jgi:uncharacterized membrane protein YgcG
MSSSQPDFGNAVDFVNALFKSGITVLRATRDFTVQGKSYPAGSLVVKTAQAFRPHVMDMFEPQDYPDDFPYPGAPPTQPYDDAGYTLAFQMGVQFDRILEGFEGPFEKLTDLAKPPAGAIKTAAAPVGYYFSHQATNSFIAINRLVAAGEDVSWLASGSMGNGTFYVSARPTTLPILQKAAADLGLSFESTSTAPTGSMAKLRKLRIGLVDRVGGGMPVGWTRLVFKNFEFPFVEDSYNDVFAPDINAGDLHAKYDVLVFNNEGLGGGGGRGGGGGAGGGRGGGGGASADVAPGDDRHRPFLPEPDKYAKRRGSIDATGQAALQQFVNDGGTIIAIGSATQSAIPLFKLPLTDHLLSASGTHVARTDYYVPGSVLQVAVDPKNPLAHGYGDKTDIFYSNNEVWTLNQTAGAPVTHAVAWFDSETPLRSGWAWGQKVLNKGVEIAEASVGKGHVYVFGNELLFRSEPHGDFKFFFNALYLSVADGLK